jgi:hypothetical protein
VNLEIGTSGVYGSVVNEERMRGNFHRPEEISDASIPSSVPLCCRLSWSRPAIDLSPFEWALCRGSIPRRTLKCNRCIETHFRPRNCQQGALLGVISHTADVRGSRRQNRTRSAAMRCSGNSKTRTTLQCLEGPTKTVSYRYSTVLQYIFYLDFISDST